MKTTTYREWKTDKGGTLLRELGNDEYFVAVANCNADELRELVQVIEHAVGDASTLTVGRGCPELLEACKSSGLSETFGPYATGISETFGPAFADPDRTFAGELRMLAEVLLKPYQAYEGKLWATFLRVKAKQIEAAIAKAEEKA